jgi:hypothetical protein
MLLYKIKNKNEKFFLSYYLMKWYQPIADQISKTKIFKKKISKDKTFENKRYKHRTLKNFYLYARIFLYHPKNIVVSITKSFIFKRGQQKNI